METGQEFPSAQKVMQYIEIILQRPRTFLDLPPDIEQSIRDALGSFGGNIASTTTLLNYIMGIKISSPVFSVYNNFPGGFIFYEQGQRKGFRLCIQADT